MKILIIARGYPTPNHPLFGCFEATQAHALQKLGHEVIYIGLNFLFSQELGHYRY